MSEQAGAKRQILVVEDDEHLRAYLCEVLRYAGYDVVQAACGEDALERVSEREPDLALLDIAMPGMSGIDLARQLQRRSAVPFMFLSGSGDTESGRLAANYGAVGYLVKPVEAAQLMPALEAALARADEIRQLRRTEANLNAALSSGRETSVAIGMLMVKFLTDRDTAFEVLRDHSRASGRKVNEVAAQLLAAEEMVNSLHAAFLRRLKQH
jgi:two-component system, response regulator PdtaR